MASNEFRKIVNFNRTNLVLMTKSISFRLVSFFALGITIIVASILILKSQSFANNPDLLSLGLTLDLTITIPLIYFLLIWKTRISNLTIIPVLILSFVIASFIIPSDHQFYLQFIEYALIPLELFIIVSIIRKTHQISKAYRAKGLSYDFTETLRSILYDKFGNQLVANIFTTEVSLFYYLFNGWRNKSYSFPGSKYSYHRENGYTAIFFTITFVMVLETVALHLFVYQFIPVLAWTLTGLGIYFMFIIFGDYNAIRNRPISLDDSMLYLRTGVRWYTEIPLSAITEVELIRSEPKIEGNANFITFGSPNIIVHLNSEYKAIGFYGISKKFTSFSFFIDDKLKFKQELDGKTKLAQEP
jgi:hypothetical protein